MKARILVLAICFFAGSAYIASASKSEPAFTREPLAALPMEIANWRGQDVPIDDRILGVLGVDDHLNRLYISPQGPLGLYVGFYQTQRQGTTIHSPLNCLPGAGWIPLDRSYLNTVVSTTADSAPQEIQINRIVIEKGLDRQLTLYWYQAHGRVVASEYWGKVYTVLDAMRMNRTDGAMVRIVVPIAGTGAQAEQDAEKAGVEFAQSIFPLLSHSLPE